MANRRVEGIRNRARSQVLFLDAFRTQTTGRREGRLGATDGSGPVDLRRRKVMIREIGNWFRRRNLENNLDRELQYHVDRRVNDLMQSGLSEDQARRQATLELGG